MVHTLEVRGDTVVIDNHSIKFETPETAKAFVVDLIQGGFLYR
jgi:hypothetical protein